MKRKCLAVGIVLLFIGTYITPGTAQDIKKLLPTSRGNILYVGGSGPGNYSTIQDAMNNASNGDTIYVYSGIYGTLTIRKSLRIIGENKYTTILNGTGLNAHDTVAIEANNVLLSGFTIQNAGIPGGNYGRGIMLYKRNNVTVSDVIFRKNYLSIMLDESNYNILLDNLTFTSNGGGISFWNVINCTISHCVFNHTGISHRGFPPSGYGSLHIQNNLFINNSCIYTGYLCIASHGTTTIESNIFQNNSCALSIFNSKGINIIKNNFINNTQNVLLEKGTYIYETLFYINYRQHWEKNYWDDWDQTGSYKIIGTWYIGVQFLYISLIKFHFREYDLNPAQEPYDIDI